MKLNILLCLIIVCSILFNVLGKKHSKALNKDIIDIPTLAHSMPYQDVVEKSSREGKIFSTSLVISKNEKFKAYVGILTAKPHVLVVSFRGTIPNWQNLAADIALIRVPISLNPLECAGCEVSSGFLVAFELLDDDMFKSIDKLLRENNQITHVVFTGHSLGGAMTTIAAYKFLIAKKNPNSLYAKIKNVSLITVGAPRVGNSQFADFLNNNRLKFNLRIIYGLDPVTGLPPACLGYKHAGTEIRYRRNPDGAQNFDRPVLGQNLQDTCNDMNLAFVGDHSVYKDINPEILWNFIKANIKVDLVDKKRLKRKFK